MGIEKPISSHLLSKLEIIPGKSYKMIIKEGFQVGNQEFIPGKDYTWSKKSNESHIIILDSGEEIQFKMRGYITCFMEEIDKFSLEEIREDVSDEVSTQTKSVLEGDQ